MGWRYYNHAMIPDSSPDEEVDITPIVNGTIWNPGNNRKPLLARWTTDYDCDHETNWWYTIKDTPFDASKLSSNRRRWINKARRNFEVREINPVEYAEEIYTVLTSAFQAYPKKYRPEVNHERFVKVIKNWEDTVLGAFWIGEEDNGERGKLCGYNTTSTIGKCIEYNVHKAIPEYEKQAVNFALMDGTLTYYEEKLKSGFYINNGQRSTYHETSFNELLIRDFMFRKAYCKLHIEYRAGVGFAVKILYPFRKLLNKFNRIGVIHQINSIMIMEEIKRSFKE